MLYLLNTIKRFTSLNSQYLKELFPYLFFIFLVWTSHFLMANSFGLYEDDWGFTGNAITNTFTQNLARVNSALVTFWQGRPLHMVFLTLIPSLGAKLGGLNALYFIGYLVLSTNACLFYSLLKFIIKQPYIPIIATLFFCLYPADTTFNFLQHLFGLQTSLLLLLLALNFYVSSRKNYDYRMIFSYIFAILSLLTYESPFLIFFTAPFLLKNKPKNQIVYHFLILTLILILYLILRKLVGEQRVVDLGLVSTIKLLVYQILVGPIVSIGTFIIRPLQILMQFEYKSLLILLIALPIFYFFINYFTFRKVEDNTVTKEEELAETRKFIGIGAIITILAYPSALTLSVNIIDGRASRVHFAAVLGTTIILSCLWTGLLLKYNQHKLFKKLTIFLLSTHLSFLLIFCINVQYFYKLSWEYQQNFWRDVITLSPDLDDGTIILVQAPNLAWGKQINPFDWSVPLVLNSIYEFPKEWKFQPRLYVLNSTLDDLNGWKKMMIKDKEFVLSGANKALRYYFDWEPERKVKPKDIILLVEENNQLVRKQVLNLSDGTSLLLRQSNDSLGTAPKFDRSILFDSLMSDKINYNINYRKIPIYFEPQSLIGH